MQEACNDLNIRDSEVYDLARQLSDLTGETLTEAVRKALRERLERRRNVEKVREISNLCASMPVLDSRSDDELVGYDEFGIPRWLQEW